MTKKHFIKAAALIKDKTEEARATQNPIKTAELFNQAKFAAETFASVAKSVNSNFDSGRFYTACGLD